MKKLIFLLAIIISCKTAKAQTVNDNLAIYISASSAFKGSYMHVEIVKNVDSIKINYKIKDSIDLTAARKDKRLVYLSGYYLQHRKDTNNDSLITLEKENDRLTEKYTHYTKGDLTINSRAYRKYAVLLNSIGIINTDSLEIAENKKAHIVMDGSHFSFFIKSANHQTCVCVHAPDDHFYFIFAELIRQTKAICKLR